MVMKLQLRLWCKSCLFVPIEQGHRVKAVAEAVDDHHVYVAGGKDVQKSRLTVLWALQNLQPKKLYLLHVHQPAQMTPSSSGLEESEINKILELELDSAYESLHKYVVICQNEGVNEQDIDATCISMSDVGQGIVELVYSYDIKKLVMGAAADNHYHEGMVSITSRKAKYVRQYAPRLCKLWFICNGNLIQSGEGQFDYSDSSVSSSEVFDSASLHTLDDLGSALIPYGGRREAEHEIDTHGPCSSGDHSVQSMSDQIYTQLTRSILEAEKNALEAIEKARELETMYKMELRLRKEAEEALKKEREKLETAKRETDEAFSSAHNAQRLYDEELQLRIEVEEVLEKEKKETKKITKEMEETLSNYMDCLHLIEMYQKEGDDTMKMNEELLRNQSEKATSSYSPSYQPPPYFICPISKEIMRNPHVAADGFTYEADIFIEWLRNGGETSPLTNLKLEHHNLIPNFTLRSAISEWLQQHPDFLIQPESHE